MLRGKTILPQARDGQFPGRIAFGGNLVRDAAQTEPHEAPPKPRAARTEP